MYKQFKEYETPSGLGGVYSLKYIKFENGLYYFRVTNKDHEHTITFTPEQAELNVSEVEK